MIQNWGLNHNVLNRVPSMNMTDFVIPFPLGALLPRMLSSFIQQARHLEAILNTLFPISHIQTIINFMNITFKISINLHALCIYMLTLLIQLVILLWLYSKNAQLICLPA